MPTFVIDEDMPRSTAKVLSENGFEALDIRDCGLRGAKDQQVFTFAQEKKAVLITGDKEFGNIVLHPLGTHHGIIVTRVPNEMPTAAVNALLQQALAGLAEDDFTGNVIVVEPRKIRIRRAQS